jgi:threonine/homoserine/homoserine lactone efflux protein
MVVKAYLGQRWRNDAGPALFLAFVLAVTVLMLIPGPNVALIVATASPTASATAC